MFLQQKVAQQTTPKGGRKMNRLGCLMKMSIGFLPIEDSHLEKMDNHRVLKNLVIQSHELFRVVDHIHPKCIIVVELGKRIVGPTQMPLKEIDILLPRKDGVPPTAIRDLMLCQCAF